MANVLLSDFLIPKMLSLLVHFSFAPVPPCPSSNCLQGWGVSVNRPSAAYFSFLILRAQPISFPFPFGHFVLPPEQMASIHHIMELREPRPCGYHPSSSSHRTTTIEILITSGKFRISSTL